MTSEMNELYQEINRLLNEDNFEDVEKILKRVDFVETHPILLVGHLTIVYSAYVHGKISQGIYKYFYDNTYDILSIIGEDPSDVLFGLEPKEKVSE